MSKMFFSFFSMYFASTCYNRFTTNQCLVFPTDDTCSPSSHHPFVFYFRIKHFSGNVSRHAFGAQSILMYIPIFQRHLKRYKLRWESVLYHVKSSTVCWKPLLTTAWEWADWRLGCSLIWPPLSNQGIAMSSSDPYHVRGLSSFFF